MDNKTYTVAAAQELISLLCNAIEENEEENRFMQDEIDDLDKFITEQLG